MPTLPTNPQSIGASGHVTDHNKIVTALSTAGYISGAQIKDYSGTVMSGFGPWSSYTVTLTGAAKGNGDLQGYYTQIGKTIIGRVYWDFGSTSTVTGPTDFSLPVAQASTVPFLMPLGMTAYYNGSTLSIGGNFIIGTQVARCIATNVAGTYASNAEVTSTVPFTWNSSSFLYAQFAYEAA